MGDNIFAIVKTSCQGLKDFLLHLKSSQETLGES